VTHYQQADSFSTVTDVPMSGTGTSSPEPAAAGADYSAWPWEAVLATVLGTPIPDRTAVSGQPWLTVVNQGQAAPASHLIWTASWDDQPTSGAASIQVYLSPGLYTTGGAWDQFENAPAAAMSAVAAANYAGLTIDPRTFQSARLALAGVTTELGTLAQQFGQLNHEATADASGFQGSLAGVVADLFSSLRTITLSLHDQMTTPASYSTTMGTTGDSAGAFLASLNSAYTGWMQVPEYSPLGAVVQALMQVAVPNGTGGYVIPSPQDTTYGDLTTPGPWAAVEQRAKTLWNAALTGNSGAFAGLDPLAQRAIGALVAQYSTAISTLAPVIGPAPPPITPKTLSHSPTSSGPKPPGLPGASGTGGADAGHGPGAQALPVPGGGPGNGPSGVVPPVSKNVVLTTGGTGGPGPASAAAVAFPVALASGTGPSGSAQAGTGPGSPRGEAEAAVLPGGLAAATLVPAGQAADEQPAAELPSGLTDAVAASDGLAPPRGLAGAIGAGAQTPRAVAAIPQSLAFAGTIGLPGPAAAGGDRRESRQARARDRSAAQARLAPAAGFAIGRDLSRGAVEQAAVPVIASKPSAVLSSAINAGSGTSAAVGGLQVSAAGPGHAGLQAGADLSASPGAPAGPGSPASVSGQGTPGGASALGGAEGAAMTSGEGAGGGSQMVMADGMGPMGMGPMGLGGMGAGGMGAGGMGGGGRLGRGQERERRAYLPQDDSYWGTSPAASAAALGADARDHLDEEFMPGSGHLAGIGADDERAPDRRPRPDRRTP
jgi:hypothetical protein